MKNWQKYIGKQNADFLQTPFPADYRADMVVVIPCYNEPDVAQTLESLCKCTLPDEKVLVAVIVNSSVRSSNEAVLQNRKTYDEIVRFAAENNTGVLRFFPLIFENLPRKHAGVGLARKIGMDAAVAYFLQNENEGGVIVSLDADCTVSANYLTDICHAFRTDGKCNATVHNFRHRVEKNNPEIEHAIRQYENYIRYFRNALRDTGFPYYYHTIGSAFAVRADAYVRVGGMGRQQGGEDFYFLQKVFALGGTKELSEVIVHPMARFSDRVPFGTGPALQKILDEPDGRMKVYSPQSFGELKRFFELKERFFKQDRAWVEAQMQTRHPAVARFVADTDFVSQIEDCNQNAATVEAFRKRFFHHFNAFKIIKFLNFSHPEYFAFENLDETLSAPFLK